MSEEESGGDADSGRRTALAVRGDHRVLRSFSDADLRAIPLFPEGASLARREWYLDLHDPARADFVAEGDESVEPGQHIVAREEVSDELWDELRRACDGVLGRRAASRLRPAV